MNSRALEYPTAMPRVCRALEDKQFQIIPVSEIDYATHLILFNAKESEIMVWLVNTHIDIESWNEVTDTVSNWVEFSEDNSEDN